jgi:hypothetical protein
MQVENVSLHERRQFDARVETRLRAFRGDGDRDFRLFEIVVERSVDNDDGPVGVLGVIVRTRLGRNSRKEVAFDNTVLVDWWQLDLREHFDHELAF